jgi:hypothetical protein
MPEERLLDDHAPLVGDVGAGVGDAVEPLTGHRVSSGIVGGDHRVEDPEPANHLGALVGEHAIGDAVLGGKSRKRGLWIVSDGVQADAGGVELSHVSLQLDQLRHAVRSPHRGSLEDDGSLVSAPIRVEVDELAALIAQAEVRKALADGRPGREIGGRNARCPCAPGLWAAAAPPDTVSVGSAT